MKISTWLVVAASVAIESLLFRAPAASPTLSKPAKTHRGEPAARHLGYPFSNAYVHNTVEAMCVALTVDPKGDPENDQSPSGYQS